MIDLTNIKHKNIEKLEKELELGYEDKKTLNFKFKDRKMDKLEKKSLKKPDYVLVQYLYSNRTMDFKLLKIVSGNIIIVNNKGHELSPKDSFVRNKKFTWYIIREWDTRPVSTRMKIEGTSTDDHPVLIKMVLGAIQKKEMTAEAKKAIIYIVVLAIIGFLVYIFFFAK